MRFLPKVEGRAVLVDVELPDTLRRVATRPPKSAAACFAGLINAEFQDNAR